MDYERLTTQDVFPDSDRFLRGEPIKAAESRLFRNESILSGFHRARTMYSIRQSISIGFLQIYQN